MTTDFRPPPIGKIKLLLALDALLREGSVTGAAASLELQVSSVSRMLGELRDLFDDPIFIRTGRGLRPTPFAESLRLRVRALAEEAEALLQGEGWTSRKPTVPAPIEHRSDGWQKPSKVAPPPLAVTRGEHLEAAPTHSGIARRIAGIGDNEEPQRRLAKYIALTSPGPGRSRTLDVEEARDALAIILRGEADPVQLGALLMTLQYRGPTALELAGFVRAIREVAASTVGPCLRPDLDWPVYVSPRWKRPPWFVHAARLVAAAGHRVVMHGHFGNGSDSGKLEQAAERAGIAVCLSSSDVSAALNASNIAYVPLAAFAPQTQSILNLHPLLETRTPLHNVLPLINPFGASATLAGSPGGASRLIYADVAKLLGMKRVTVASSVRSFAQVNPTRATTLTRIFDGREISERVPVRPEVPGSGLPSSGYSQREYWEAVWSGAARDDLAEASIIYTAAAALLSVSGDPGARFDDCLKQATDHWRKRGR
ncbi:anthranilate phosphoribosyltransferase [Pseudorhizobium tarimense]|uniref:Anthranilate phosphoribosyltransferase n=1 Tax=Pseudorhizobium tarimense TaxID=1079109 RepID=A0ABV2HBG4_9HYPH|nr:glycosyl transferase family protein [Pseudorhizobium tarimense]MCJ8520947.1 glycosyl transferase family protein [Pseudorhizobium tarimense]